MSIVGDSVEAAPSGASVDPRRAAAQRRQLLEGEDPTTQRADDAMHWMTVYGELVSYTEGLVALANRQLEDASPQPSFSVPDADMDVRALRRHLAWYRRRLKFWTGRVSELGFSKTK
jgi:hypothetical protein